MITEVMISVNCHLSFRPAYRPSFFIPVTCVSALTALAGLSFVTNLLLHGMGSTNNIRRVTHETCNLRCRHAYER